MTYLIEHTLLVIKEIAVFNVALRIYEISFKREICV
jgi:hypothetical protein